VEWCWQVTGIAGRTASVTGPLCLPNIAHGETWDRSGERPATDRLSQRQTHSVSVIQTGQLMLYREIMAVCSEIHTKQINTVCGAERGITEC